MKKILALAVAVLDFVLDLPFNVKYLLKYGNRNPLAYERREMPDDERRAMREQVDREAAQFIEQMGTTPPWAWDIGAQAWYESIRRREAEAS